MAGFQSLDDLYAALKSELGEDVDKKLEKIKEEDEPQSVLDLNPFETKFKDWMKFVIDPAFQKAKEEPDMVFDDYYNIWYNQMALKHVMKPDTYEGIKQLYWTPLLFEPIETFFDKARRIQKEVESKYKNALAKIDERYGSIMLLDLKINLAKERKKDKSTGTPGNTPEEAQHYAHKKADIEKAKEIDERVHYLEKIVYGGLAHEELGMGAYNTEAATEA